MIKVTEFEEQIPSLLPVTLALLKSANLTIHDQVRQITVHGSRGLAGCYRPDSDIDLCLIVDMGRHLPGSGLESFLQSVLETTITNWRSSTSLDLAIVFDSRHCGLKCFGLIAFDPQACPEGGADCFGLYKTQSGFKGIVTDAGVKVKLMYPCITIWKRR